MFACFDMKCQYVLCFSLMTCMLLFSSISESYGHGLGYEIMPPEMLGSKLVSLEISSDTWPDKDGRLDHGTMFSRAIKENLIDTKHTIQVGIRTHNSNTKGVTILDAPWVHKNGVDKVIKKIIEVVKDRPAYLTFDIDGLDPAYAPGTGTPVAGGLTSAQALAIIRGLDGLNFIGADVVEVAPAYDHAEITAIAAATIAHDYLVIRAKQKMIDK